VLIVAERINATRKRIRRAIEERDTALIQKEAVQQAQAGGDYIDANAGIDVDREADDLAWLVQTIQAAVDKPLCIDSTYGPAQAAALKLHKGQAIVNSISAEEGRSAEILPLVQQYNTLLVGLTMESTVPTDKEGRLAAAETIVRIVKGAGIGLDRLLFDPVVATAATDPNAPLAVRDTIVEMKQRWPECRTIVGLSNVSFGLPVRTHLNRTFLAFLIEAGLDAAIIDPTEPNMVATVRAAEALLGKDEFCMNYITAHREGLL